jgi:hypothetical protein
MNSSAAPVVAWGMTAIARSSSSSGDRIYKVTITLDDASTYVFDPETVLGAVTTNDTFFGYQAPTGRTIASVRLDADPGPNGGTSTQHAWDDMGFVVVPEPTSIALMCTSILGLGIVGLRRKK